MTFTVHDLRLALIGLPDEARVRVVVRPDTLSSVSCPLTSTALAAGDNTPGLLFLIGDVEALDGGS